MSSRSRTLDTIAWGSLAAGAIAIVTAFEIEFDSGFSLVPDPVALWQTLPLVLAALLFHERVMHPLTAVAATVAGVSLILLELVTTDWESSSTAAIGLIFTPILPVLAVSTCLLAQVVATTLIARVRRVPR